jgi:hypothetical protein
MFRTPAVLHLPQGWRMLSIMKIVELYRTLSAPLFGERGIGNLILVSPQGNEIVHLIIDETGELISVEQDTGAATSPIVAPFLSAGNADAPPLRMLGGNMVDNETYYYTALPVSLDDEFHGVIVIGTPIRAILPFLKNTALADVVIYGSNGQVIATTLGAADQKTLEMLSISEETIFGDS